LNYYLTRFKRTVNNFKKDEVYLFDEVNLRTIPRQIVEFMNIDEIADYKDQPNLLIIRSGGMGDIAALSCLHDKAPRVTLYTQAIYQPIAELWETKPIFKALTRPLFNVDSIAKLRLILTQYGQLSKRVDDIEKGSKENWYDIFQQSAGIEAIRRWPCLKYTPTQTIEGCLLVTKASAKHRTLNHTDVHDVASLYFDKVVNANDMKWNTAQYIEALASYKYCITTDTSAVHIREGLNKQTIALYGPFTSGSRVGGYAYTKAINVKSSCAIQPCHRPNKMPCPFIENGFAPCMQGHEMKKQLRQAIESILTPIAP
jgi:hypothetical protein